jgi:hypothetical protein
MLEMKVCKTRGKCPVYKVGDKMVINDSKIIVGQNRCGLYSCTIDLASLRYILEHDWCPVKLRLTTSQDPDHAYTQGVDPKKPYTEGRTVFF